MFKFMKIEGPKNYPFVEPVKKIGALDNEPKRRGQAGQQPETLDRVEISREAQLRIELGQIRELMRGKIDEPKAYAVLEKQYREVKQALEELEL